MGPVVLSADAYIKAVLHAAKNFACEVNGVLLGTAEGDRLVVRDAMPLFHSHLALAPMLEAAMMQVEEYCAAQRPALQILGYYHANERSDDSELNLTARRIADKIQSYFSSACLLLLNPSKLDTDDGSAFEVFQRDGSSWKKRGPPELEDSSAARKACNYMRAGLAGSLVDFDDHLDNPTSDWLNPGLLQSLAAHG
eukprot:tig00000711_g3419.t1